MDHDYAHVWLFSMADASQYTSRRASAASAAEAHNIVPINAKSTRKRKETTEGDTDATNRGRGVRTPLRAPPASRLLDDYGRLALLQTHGEIDADEAYGEQEKALSEFLRLHPMLSLCAATAHFTRVGVSSSRRPRRLRVTSAVRIERPISIRRSVPH